MNKENLNKMRISVICLLLVITFALVGCGYFRPQNPEQITFMEKTQSLYSEKMRLSIISFAGKDASGKVAPSDIDSQVEKIEQEILHLLKDSRPEVVKWNATVSSVKRNGDEIVIHSLYGSHHYRLNIFDAQSIKIAENLLEDDEITFSGNLGAETSLTLFGAVSLSEFSLYPTSVVSKHGEIKQSTSVINEK